MQIPKNKIEDLQKRFKNEFEVDISFEEAEKLGEKLISILETVCLTEDCENS